jgi:hypothetical protein
MTCGIAFLIFAAFMAAIGVTGLLAIVWLAMEMNK